MPIRERTIVDIREEMALRALDERYTVTEVSALYGVTRPTVRLWRDRYRERGRAGLVEQSHAPHSCPHRTEAWIEELIVAERRRWGWGSKKILARLSESHPDLRLPKRATVDAILSRHGFVSQRPRRVRAKTPFARRYDATEAGELTTIDYKGQFRMRNGRYCYPLTIVDRVSRFLLACEALESTAFGPTWRIVERVFREYGLPQAMQSDNGVPFGAIHGFSTMAVCLMALDIQPIYSRPGRPGDNGSHERMHRDLKAAAARPPAENRRGQQLLFDRFRRTYNEERPHEGIAMQRPARLYSKGAPRRSYPSKVHEPEYAGHFETRAVASTGVISWRGDKIFVGEAFGGRRLGLEATADGIWTVHFYRFVIGSIDERRKCFV